MGCSPQVTQVVTRIDEEFGRFMKQMDFDGEVKNTEQPTCTTNHKLFTNCDHLTINMLLDRNCVWRQSFFTRDSIVFTFWRRLELCHTTHFENL